VLRFIERRLIECLTACRARQDHPRAVGKDEFASARCDTICATDIFACDHCRSAWRAPGNQASDARGRAGEHVERPRRRGRERRAV
jgi:hypothetical protein